MFARTREVVEKIVVVKVKNAIEIDALMVGESEATATADRRFSDLLCGGTWGLWNKNGRQGPV